MASVVMRERVLKNGNQWELHSGVQGIQSNGNYYYSHPVAFLGGGHQLQKQVEVAGEFPLLHLFSLMSPLFCAGFALQLASLLLG